MVELIKTLWKIVRFVVNTISTFILTCIIIELAGHLLNNYLETYHVQCKESNNKYVTFDEGIFRDIDEEDFNKKRNEYGRYKEESRGASEAAYNAFVYLTSTWRKTEDEAKLKRYNEIEEKLYLINFKKLETKGHCSVLDGIHIDHFPAVMDNIANMLHFNKEQKKKMLQAVNIKNEFKDNIDSFNLREYSGEKLFGQFAIKKISPKWILIVYTVKFVRFTLTGKQGQTNLKNISDLIVFSKEGIPGLTMKAEKFMSLYYRYEAEQHFNKKCRFVLPKSSKPQDELLDLQ